MSAGLAVEALSLRLGAFQIGNLDLAVSPGEILAILGPNGAGKSVTLETIAGFHRPDRGRVLIGGRDVTALAPERRSIGFVVQNFGLFPHLTVTQNVAIARRARRKDIATDRAIPVPRDDAGLLAYVGAAHLAQRWPQDLSPGEKQRVALARALASAPDLFLFDEPFAALDGQTRDQLRYELHAFLRALSIPAIFVTHDHADAMMIADRIAVLRNGAVVQSGPTTEIFAKPANAFVAHFIGMENVLDAAVVETAGELATLALGGRNLHASATAGSVSVGDSVCVAIGGEHVTIRLPESKQSVLPAINQLDGRVTSVRYLGPLATIEIDCGFALKGYLLAPHARAMNIDAGRLVAVEIAADAIHVMANEATGNAPLAPGDADVERS
jgi:molybdate/tungstate transport system ATP-binding protein